MAKKQLILLVKKTIINYQGKHTVDYELTAIDTDMLYDPMNDCYRQRYRVSDNQNGKFIIYDYCFNSDEALRMLLELLPS